MIWPVHDLTYMIWFPDLIFPCISIFSHICLKIFTPPVSLFLSFHVTLSGASSGATLLKIAPCTIAFYTMTLLCIFSSFLCLLIYDCSFICMCSVFLSPLKESSMRLGHYLFIIIQREKREVLGQVLGIFKELNIVWTKD